MTLFGKACESYEGFCEVIRPDDPPPFEEYETMADSDIMYTLICKYEIDVLQEFAQ